MDYSIHDAIEAGFNHVVFICELCIRVPLKLVILANILQKASKYAVFDTCIFYMVELYPLSRTFLNLSTHIFRHDFFSVSCLIDRLYFQYL